MIANRKDIFFFLEMTVLTIIALVYGFSLIPSPMEQQKLHMDHQRVIDLGNIRYAIDAYYTDKQQLPASLEIVKRRGTAYTGTVIKFADPETNTPYSYTITSPTSYKLCATFTTDNNTLSESKDYDNQKYEYTTYRNEFIHAKDNVCFEETVQEVSTDGVRSNSAASAEIPLPSPTIMCANGQCPQVTPTAAVRVLTPTTAVSPSP